MGWGGKGAEGEGVGKENKQIERSFAVALKMRDRPQGCRGGAGKKGRKEKGAQKKGR